MPTLQLAAVAIALLLAGCAGPAVSLGAPDEVAGSDRLAELWVVRHGWHTRVVVRTVDIDPAIWPESRVFSDARYLEVGWGDRDFYSEHAPSICDAIDPVIRATPAALHVGALDRPPSEVFPSDTVVRVLVPVHGLNRLASFVDAHYVRDARGRPQLIGPGSSSRSAFYLAKGRYHVLAYNSNHWTATVLRTAGAAMDPSDALTAAAVMRQARRIAASAGSGLDCPDMDQSCLPEKRLRTSAVSGASRESRAAARQGPRNRP